MDYTDRNRNLDHRISEALNQKERASYAKSGSTGGNEGHFDVDDKSTNRMANRINRRERNTESRRHLGTGGPATSRNFAE